MRRLTLPPDLKLAGIETALADDDAMFEGDDAHYLGVGRSAAAAIQDGLRDRPAPRRILDLPCGHGRVTRMLRALYPAAAITVCDLDRSGVDFAAATFGARGVYSRADFRALVLGETYDLIWVGSLITHLPEPGTRRFLDFALRHLAPRGTLVITSHGAHVADRLRHWLYGLTEDAAATVIADAHGCGYGYHDYPDADGYGVSVISRRWFEDLFARGPLRLDRYAAQAWDDHHDVLVLRGPASRWLRPYYDRRCTPAAGFDEAWYLAENPLVAAAVVERSFASGWEHYRDYGRREGRAPGRARDG